MAKMRPFKLFSRITGLSTPVFGISWTPPKDEAEIARKIITFLEDRRVLYVRYEDEQLRDATESILTIRSKLTEYIGELDSKSDLQRPLRAMRNACLHFLGGTEHINTRSVPANVYHGKWSKDEVRFFVELGKLRAVFGFHLLQIAIEYDIDVEERLAVIFPQNQR